MDADRFEAVFWIAFGPIGAFRQAAPCLSSREKAEAQLRFHNVSLCTNTLNRSVPERRRVGRFTEKDDRWPGRRSRSCHVRAAWGRSCDHPGFDLRARRIRAQVFRHLFGIHKGGRVMAGTLTDLQLAAALTEISYS